MCPWARQGWMQFKDVWNMCPWEGNAVCLCWQRRYHPCSAPQREKGEERGQLRKRADMRRNKPVIARDSAYSAKSTTMPVKSLSTLLAPSSHFGFSTFQRTGAGFKCMMATWDRGAVGSASYCHCFPERFSRARRQELKWRGGSLTEGELVGGGGQRGGSHWFSSQRLRLSWVLEQHAPPALAIMKNCKTSRISDTAALVLEPPANFT